MPFIPLHFLPLHPGGAAPSRAAFSIRDRWWMGRRERRKQLRGCRRHAFSIRDGLLRRQCERRKPLGGCLRHAGPGMWPFLSGPSCCGGKCERRKQLCGCGRYAGPGMWPWLRWFYAGKVVAAERGAPGALYRWRANKKQPSQKAAALASKTQGQIGSIPPERRNSSKIPRQSRTVATPIKAVSI